MASVPRVPSVGLSLAWVGWLVVAGLIFASGMVWTVTRDREDQRLFDQQDLRAVTLQKALEDQLVNVDEPLHWNEQWFNAAGYLDRRRFESFNASLLSRIPSILMLEWSPRVWFADRERFVRAARAEVAKDYDILAPDETGLLRPSKIGVEYYLPVLYSVARPGVDSAIGLNVNFSADRRQWYENSARNASAITTGVIPIFVSTKLPARPGFVHSRPVYAGPLKDAPEARRAQLLGWVAAVVTLDELFADSLDKQLTPEFDFLIYEQSPAGAYLIGERSMTRGNRVSLPQERFSAAPDDVVKTLQVGNRSWGVVVRPTPAWYSATSHAESTRSLLISLTFTALISFSMWRQLVNRRRTEVLQARIAAREALLHDVTNGVPVAVYQARTIADGEPRVTFVSDQVETVLGVSESDVRQNANNFIRNVDVSVTPRRQVGFASGADEPAEVYCLLMNGKKRWVEHRAVERLQVGTGARVTTGYWADVTELTLREQQITRAKDQAEQSRQKLQEAVVELERTRGALVQSEKLASLGSMVAGVSHELNTPLGNALLAGTGLLQSLQETRQRLLQGELKKSKLEKFFDEALAAAELVSRSVERAAALVTGFKQSAVNQTAQERERFDLSLLLQQAVTNARARYAQAPWKFAFSENASIAMDSFPKPLEQILGSLIENSVAHGFFGRADGTVEITCRLLDAASGQEGWVEIVVADNGCGIAAGSASRVFDPFFTTRMGRHVGMGLNVVHRMTTTVLGGNITLAPSSDQGARFVLHLPLEAPHII